MALHNRNGSSFIELMAALALLAFFGTSLFLVQNNLFARLIKTHAGVLNLLVVPKYFLEFDEKMLPSQNPAQITIHHENQNPEYTINLNIKPFDHQSAISKTFGDFCALNQAEIEQDGKTYKYVRFICTKAKPKDKPKKEKQTTSESESNDKQN